MTTLTAPTARQMPAPGEQPADLAHPDRTELPGRQTFHGPTREYVYAWQLSADGGEGTTGPAQEWAALEIGHNRHSKRYEVRAYAFRRDGIFTVRAYGMLDRTRESGVTLRTEPAARYSAKRLGELAAEALPALATMLAEAEPDSVLRAIFTRPEPSAG